MSRLSYEYGISVSCRCVLCVYPIGVSCKCVLYACLICVSCRYVHVLECPVSYSYVFVVSPGKVWSCDGGQFGMPSHHNSVLIHRLDTNKEFHFLCQRGLKKLQSATCFASGKLGRNYPWGRRSYWRVSLGGTQTWGVRTLSCRPRYPSQCQTLLCSFCSGKF